MPSKGYYAIIPANVRYCDGLTPNAKLLYGEITALTNEKGYCWATNAYFADLYKTTVRSVSKWISQLAELGFIRVELSYGPTQKVQSRKIWLDGMEENVMGGRKKLIGGVEENFKGPTKKCSNIIIHNNNTVNTTVKRFSPPTSDEVTAYCLERNNSIDGQHFVDWYTTKGWMVGKNKMKDWKAAIRTWEKRDIKPAGKPNATRNRTMAEDLLDRSWAE
jgi:hypothetical protein